MSHLKLKQIAGPNDGKQGSVIIFDSTPKWSTDLNTAIQLPTGSSAERPQTASPGMMRYNEDLQTVEFNNGTTWKRVDPDVSIYLQRYVFRMEYTEQQQVGAITGLPQDWTVVGTGPTSFTINTGLGRPPAGGFMYGLVSLSGTQYQLRNFTTAVEIEYNTNTPNQFTIQGLTSPSFIGTVAGGHVYFHLYI